MKEYLKCLYQFISLFFKTIVSVFSIIIFSSIRAAMNVKKLQKLKLNEECCVLGNGPSLKKVLDNDMSYFISKDLIVVNKFCNSLFFFELKPRFYVISDSLLFDEKSEIANELINSLKKVVWELYIFVPVIYKKSLVIDEIAKNSYIHVILSNTTPVEGFAFFENFCYKYGLGMPTVMNVLISANMNSIYLGYSNVYIFGAEHSWMKQLKVGDDNVLLYDDPHFYSTDLDQTIFRAVYTNIANECRCMFITFTSHMKVNRFSKSVGCNLFNCTKDSYIDSYPKQYLK